MILLAFVFWLLFREKTFWFSLLCTWGVHCLFVQLLCVLAYLNLYIKGVVCITFSSTHHTLKSFLLVAFACVYCSYFTLFTVISPALWWVCFWIAFCLGYGPIFSIFKKPYPTKIIDNLTLRNFSFFGIFSMVHLQHSCFLNQRFSFY